MTASCFRTALLAITLAFGAGTLEAAPPARPTITAITLTLDDGRGYAVSPQQLADPKGGAIFWGTWAVTNILAPHFMFEPQDGVSARSVMDLWTAPGASGQLPAFLVNTAAGPVYPLDPGGPQAIAGSALRPQVQAILVGFADGRTLALNQLALTDGRSGVLIWNDFAVASLFIPFYLMNPSLPTRPGDVLRLWNQPVTAPGQAKKAASAVELPAYMVKPQCMPQYPVAD